MTLLKSGISLFHFSAWLRETYSSANKACIGVHIQGLIKGGGGFGVMWVRTTSTLFRESQNFIKRWGGGECHALPANAPRFIRLPNSYPDPPFRNPVSVPDILHLKLQPYKNKVMVVEVSFL